MTTPLLVPTDEAWRLRRAIEVHRRAVRAHRGMAVDEADTALWAALVHVTQ